MRALVIGTGSIGRRHVATLRSFDPGTGFALLRDAGRQDDYSAGLGAEVFADIASAIAWRPDVAVVATPSDRHREVVAPLIEAGVATFIEKPVVTSIDDVERLEALCAAGPLPPSQVGCVLRFLPAVEALKRWIEEGRCGSIVRASFEAGQYLPDWRPSQDYRQSYSADPARGGGVVFDLIHELDLALHLFGDVELLSAAAATNSRLEIASEDSALIALRSHDGALVSVALDYVSRRPVRRIDIVGDEATLRLDFVAKRLERITAQASPEIETDGFDIDHAYRSEIAELIEAARTGTPTRLPLAEGLKATRLAIEARALAGIGASAEEEA